MSLALCIYVLNDQKQCNFISYLLKSKIEVFKLSGQVSNMYVLNLSSAIIHLFRFIINGIYFTAETAYYLKTLSF